MRTFQKDFLCDPATIYESIQLYNMVDSDEHKRENILGIKW